MFPIRDDNRSSTFPIFTIGLITINLSVFILQLIFITNDIDLNYLFGLRPVLLVEQFGTYPILTLFSSIFLHAGILHLLGNLWFLWIFGNNIEDALGHLKFLLLYFLCGIGAHFLHILTNMESIIPTIGASGAISGILGAYAILFPHARILTILPVFIFHFVHLRAYFFMGFWFIYQFIGGLQTGLNTTGGIAWFAHIGGFLTGMILIKLIPKRKKFLQHRKYYSG